VPELPDVEGFRRTMARHATGKTITNIVVPDTEIVRNASPAVVAGTLRRRTLEKAERHGKWLIARADGPALLFHFGMTGDLIWGENARDRHPHDRAIMVFGDGELRYRNMRRFGGLWLARDDAEREELLGGLGPDALRVSRARFLERLGARRGRLKPALMDQTVVAGPGNLVVDETLWSARLSPLRTIASLTDDERTRLFNAMHDVLKKSSRRGYIPEEPGWLITVRGNPGASCPRCGTTLRRMTVGGRTTYWCPRCQPD
jgi:formamidopyrimidine-DNA glycosylase